MGHPPRPTVPAQAVGPRSERPVGRPLDRAARHGDRRAAGAGPRPAAGAPRDRRREPDRHACRSRSSAWPARARACPAWCCSGRCSAVRGSYLPSAINLIQLVGWTAFELWAMSRVANAVARDAIGLDAPFLWLLVVAVVCTALARSEARSWSCAGGSSGSASGSVAAVALWITFRVLDGRRPRRRSGTAGDRRPAVLAGRRPGDRDAGVVAAARRGLQPVRPRRTRRGRRHVLELRGRATCGSTRSARCWCCAAGRGAGRARHRHDGRRPAGGAVVLLALLVGESDQAFGEHLLERGVGPERPAERPAAPVDRGGGRSRGSPSRPCSPTRPARSSCSCS